MQLEGVVKVGHNDVRLVEKLADLAGESFLEEVWTKTLLDGAALTDRRRRELSCGLMEKNISGASLRDAVFCTPDESALAIGYLKSELPVRWAEVEDKAYAAFSNELLDVGEAKALSKRMREMATISNFSWHDAWIEDNMPGSDYIHLVCLAVGADHRGSGAFRRLVEPFLDFADEHGIPCMLETYSDDLEHLYNHFGFQTVAIHRDPDFHDFERCMVRFPVSV